MGGNHRALGWSGRKVQRLRAAWAAELPVPCSRCGRPVEPGQPWDLDHPLGIDTAPDYVRPAHARCNRANRAASSTLPPAAPSRPW